MMMTQARTASTVAGETREDGEEEQDDLGVRQADRQTPQVPPPGGDVADRGDLASMAHGSHRQPEQLSSPKQLQAGQQIRVTSGDLTQANNDCGGVDAHSGSDAKDRFERGSPPSFESDREHVRHVWAGWDEGHQNDTEEAR